MKIIAFMIAAPTDGTQRHNDNDQHPGKMSRQLDCFLPADRYRMWTFFSSRWVSTITTDKTALASAHHLPTARTVYHSSCVNEICGRHARIREADKLPRFIAAQQ
jgi:hypothetical protein